MKIFRILLTLPLAVGAAAALAAPDAEHGGRRGPPPEAIEACADLAESNACTFVGRRGDTLEGSCVVDDRGSDELLACLPTDAPKPRGENLGGAKD